VTTSSHDKAEWFACVCGSEFRSEDERDQHVSRRGCVLIPTRPEPDQTGCTLCRKIGHPLTEPCLP
jgi:hypothetical protein